MGELALRQARSDTRELPGPLVYTTSFSSEIILSFIASPGRVYISAEEL